MRKIIFNIGMLLLIFHSSGAYASGLNFNDTTQQPIAPNASGNVGIGSLAPGAVLDVNGTTRTTGFTLTGQGAAAGNVMVSNAIGVGTWMPASTIGAANGTNYWLLNGGNNVGINTTQTVGIGTSFTGGVGEAKLSIMNGNVGIGTWLPAGALDVEGTLSTAIFNGYVGIGTTQPTSELQLSGTGIANGIGFNQGNKVIYDDGAGDIGFYWGGPSFAERYHFGQTQLSMGSGNQPTINNLNIEFQPALDDVTTGMGWGNNGVLQLFAGNASIQVMTLNNGNVGIGTSVPPSQLIVNGGVGIGTSLTSFAYVGINSAPAGGLIVQNNVGIGSVTPGQALDVQGTARMTGFTLTGNGAGATKVLTSDANGNGTWQAAGAGSNYWTLDTGNIGINTTNNIGIGTIAAVNKLNVLGNIGIGTFSYDPYMTLAAPTGGMIVSGNVGIGTWAPHNNLELPGNIGISNTFSLVGIGTTDTYLAIRNNKSGTYFGYESGQGDNSIFGSNENTGAGAFALQQIFGGAYNTAIGFNALQMNIVGNSNTAVGVSALRYETGFYNTAVGLGALIFATTGQSNTAIGYDALSALQTGSTNVAIGYFAGANIDGFGSTIVGSNNVWIGANSGPDYPADVSNSVGIGSFALAGANNVMVLGGIGPYALNVGIGTDMNGATGSLIVLGNNVGIGSVHPGTQLDVNGTARMTGFTLTGNGAGAGKVLTSDANGDGTWSAASGSNYWLLNGGVGNIGINTSYAVGIGTSFTGGANEAALSVMNGNVGIGTWTPSALLAVNGNTLLGSTGSTSDSIVSNGIGSMAGGTAFHSGGFTGSITSSSTGSLAFGDAEGVAIDPGSITANNTGAVALGLADAGSITASGAGSFVMGNAVLGATLQATGSGSIAMGYAQNGTTLQATGTGSVAIGQTVQANANNNLAFGLNVINNLADTFMVGFNTTPTMTVTSNNVGVGTFTPASVLTVNGGLGIGTTLTNSAYVGINSAPSGGLIVQGNVGIGTFNPFGGQLIVSTTNGNVGIGSLTPGQALDVQGTARMTGFTLTGNGAGAGKVLTSDASGDGTWSAASGSNYWLLNGGAGNIGINTSYAVGIGTSFTGGAGEAVLSVMNGNVGIGTWKPRNSLDIVNGNIGIGTFYNLVGIGTTSTILSLRNDTSSIYVGWQAGASTAGGAADNSVLGYQALTQDTTGNNNTAVGYTALPANTSGIDNTALGAESLFSTGTGNRNTAVGYNSLTYVGIGGVTYSDNTAIGYQSGYASGGAFLTQLSQTTFIGDGSAAQLNNDTNETAVGYNAIGNGSNSVTLGNTSVIKTVLEGNVGIGTFSTNNQLTLNGAVGIGTANSAFVTTVAPAGGMIVQGNVGIGSLTPGQALDVQGTARMTGFTLTGNGAGATKVLTSDANGNGTWQAAGAGSNYWLLNGGAGNIGINTSYAVGIGTSFTGGTGEATLSVMNGNVGIGTWLPIAPIQVGDASQGTATHDLWAGPTGFTDLGNWITSPNDTKNLFVADAAAGNSSYVSLLGWTRASAGSAVNLLSAAGVAGEVTVQNPSNTINSALGVQGEVDINNNGTLTNAFGVIGQIGREGGTGTVTNTFLFNAETATNAGGTMTNVYGFYSNNQTVGGSNYGVYINQTTAGANNYSLYSAGAGKSYFAGNVGIGSLTPGQILDVQGNGRMTGFTLTGNGAAAGSIMVSNAIGIGTWMATSTLPSATVTTETGGDVTFYSNNTTLAGGPGFQTNGTNVGIGTSGFTHASLQVVGNIGIGTIKNGDNFITTSPPNGGMIIESNVGIGTWNPGAALQVNNTVSLVTEITNTCTGGGSDTINWKTGNKQELSLSIAGACTLSFAAPGGIAALQLKITWTDTNATTVVWNSSPKWPGGIAPTLTATNGAIDVVNCYYDGTNYFCQSALNFS